MLQILCVYHAFILNFSIAKFFFANPKWKWYHLFFHPQNNIIHETFRRVVVIILQDIFHCMNKRLISMWRCAWKKRRYLKSMWFQGRQEFLHLWGRMQSVVWDFQRPPRVTNWKCLALVYSPDQVKRKILEVWVRRQARLVQINGLIISYWETIPKR